MFVQHESYKQQEEEYDMRAQGLGGGLWSQGLRLHWCDGLHKPANLLLPHPAVLVIQHHR